MFKDTLSKIFKVDSLLSNLTGYVETRVELIKIEVREDLTKGLAQAVSYLLIAFVTALFITFISIALALLLGLVIGTIAGFVVIALVYLIAAGILWLSRARIIAGMERTLSTSQKKKN